MRLRQLITATWSLMTTPLFVSRPQRGVRDSVDAPRDATITHDALTDIIATAQHHDGTLDYRRIDVHILNTYITGLSAVQPDNLPDDDHRLSYWINLYNALVMQQIIVHDYPDSVQSVDGFFTTPMVTIAGESLSLDGIEHGKVRRFADPRIHAALVCGAQGCPIVTTYKPYTLNQSLDAALNAFLSDPTRGVYYNTAEDTVYITPILRWFAGDFAGPLAYISIQRLTPVVTPYLSEAGQRAWHRRHIRVRNYDWRLNHTDTSNIHHP
ncbi:MAG: DUF547 domain-containing protein [Chloroflexi bacterium]|nr:DUF547 domain-containing protein [Chloroflexota bacterium]